MGNRWGNVHAFVQLATPSGMFRRSASLDVPRFVISRCLPSQIYVHICRICLVGSIEGFSPESEAFLHDPLHEEIHQSRVLISHERENLNPKPVQLFLMHLHGSITETKTPTVASCRNL